MREQIEVLKDESEIPVEPCQRLFIDILGRYRFLCPELCRRDRCRNKGNRGPIVSNSVEQRSRVDLPDPDGPIIETISPGMT